MQIALVAVVLLAGIWFAVLRPKATTAPSSEPVAAHSAPVAPGVKGLASAVQKAKGAAVTSATANAKAGADAATATAKPAPAAKATVTKAAATTTKPKAAATATAKAATPARATTPATAATPVDPSQVLLADLAKGKTVVLLFHADGADDHAARKAVHKVALTDKHVVAAYADISKVGLYSAITSGIDVITTPTVLVIGSDRHATVLTDLIDPGVIRQAVGDARRAAAKGK